MEQQLAHRAALGSKEALEQLKALHPRKEFRRFFAPSVNSISS